MKNGLLIWNVVLSLVVGLLLFLQFRPKKNSTDKEKISANNTITDSFFRIAYFEMDSVEANYNLVKDVKAEIDEKEIENNIRKNKLDQIVKNKFKEYTQKTPLTQEDEAAAQNVIKQLNDSITIQKQEIEQDQQAFVMLKKLELKKKIGEFITEFNKSRRYSFIVSDDTGLFYFKDSVYNITSELVRGLNDQYKFQKQ